MVDDDDGDESPSPEPRTDSRSGFPREIRAWRRLRIVKHDDFFSLIFFLPESQYMELELASEGHQGAHKVGARPREARPHPHGQGVGPLVFIFGEDFFIIYCNVFRGVSGHSENFYFCTKTTPW